MKLGYEEFYDLETGSSVFLNLDTVVGAVELSRDIINLDTVVGAVELSRGIRVYTISPGWFDLSISFSDFQEVIYKHKGIDHD